MKKEQRNVKSRTCEAVENNSKQVHLDFHNTVSLLLPTPRKHECTHSIFISHTHGPPCKSSFGKVWIVSKAAFTPNPALQKRPAGKCGGRAHCATASFAGLTFVWTAERYDWQRDTDCSHQKAESGPTLVSGCGENRCSRAAGGLT